MGPLVKLDQIVIKRWHILPLTHDLIKTNWWKHRQSQSFFYSYSV